MNVYADTSFLVSLYTTDANTAEAEKHFATHPRLWLSPLHRAELTHAISQRVFRRHISAHEAQQVFKQFEQDRTSRLWEEVDMPDGVFDACIRLARKQAAKLGVRTLDTLHVASALKLGAQEFWTFDGRQSKLARAEGLKLMKP